MADAAATRAGRGAAGTATGEGRRGDNGRKTEAEGDAATQRGVGGSTRNVDRRLSSECTQTPSLHTPTKPASVRSARTPVLSARKTDRYGFFLPDADASSSAPTTPRSPRTPAGAGGAGAGAGAGATPGTPVATSSFLESSGRKTVATPAKERARIRLENQRTEKWRQMLAKWHVYSGKQAAVLKRRLRKGIPEAIRGAVWTRIVGADAKRAANPDLYASLLRRSYTSTDEIMDVIERDIPRTLPMHSMFAEPGGLGQAALFRVLRAYATYDKKVGYCQGMGFITALFLIYMPEEDAFFMLLSVLQYQPHMLAGLYEPGMPRVGMVHYQFAGLVTKKFPKLSAHLTRQGLHPTIYASQWFISIFTYNFHCAFSTRVWDSFLHEGWKVAFRVALALLKQSRADLLKLEFEDIMHYFRDLPSKVDPDAVLKTAFGLSLKRKELDKLQRQYEATNMSTVDLAHSTARK